MSDEWPSSLLNHKALTPSETPTKASVAAPGKSKVPNIPSVTHFDFLWSISAAPVSQLVLEFKPENVIFEWVSLCLPARQNTLKDQDRQ